MDIINFPENFYEKAILNRCLNGEMALVLGSGVLPANTFKVPAHKKIFAAMVGDNYAGREITLPEMARHFIGDTETILALVNCSENYSSMALEKIINIAQVDAKIESVIAEVTDTLAEIRSADRPEDYPFEERLKTIADKLPAINKATKRIDEGLNMETLEAIERDVAAGGVTAIKTRIKKLDHYLGGGVKPGKLITIASRPGCGKTALATNIALSAALDGYRSLYFTIELDSQEITERYYCTQGRIKCSSMASRKFEPEEMDRLVYAAQVIQSLPLGVNSTTGGNWEFAETAIANECEINGCNLVVVDYIQQFHLQGRGISAREEINFITGRCKHLAMKYRVPFLILAQLNREVEKRIDKIPQLSDLKESGSIEQDSDFVAMLFRNEEHGKLMCRVAKNRQGESDIFFSLEADLATNKFLEGGDVDVVETTTEGPLSCGKFNPTPATAGRSRWGNRHDED